VYGAGPLPLRVMRDILLEEGTERAYQGHARAEASEEGSAKWAANNPGAASLLALAMKAFNSDVIQD